MKISIQYNNINIRMTIKGGAQGDLSAKIYTQEELSRCLYQIVDQRKPGGNRAFYLYNLYIEDSNKLKSLANHTVQSYFNEVIQLFIDLKEQDLIRTDNVNNIILNVKFHDSKDRSSTKLVGKLIQFYNPSKSIKISSSTIIDIATIQGVVVDKDISTDHKNCTICHKDCQIIFSAKKVIQPNIIQPINSKDVNSSSTVSKCNDKLNENELELSKYLEVDGIMEESVNNICLTPPWYNDDSCSVM